MSFSDKIEHLCTKNGVLECWHFDKISQSYIFKQRRRWVSGGLKDLPEYYDAVSYTDGSCFAIGRVEADSCWSIFHLPSESVLSTGYNRKSDAEFVMEALKVYLKEDYDAIWLYNPNNESIRSRLLPKLSHVYQEYIYTKSYHYKVNFKNK